MFIKRSTKASGSVTKEIHTDPKLWTVPEVCAWLDKIGMSKYKKAFVDNAISGTDLLDLTDNDLCSIHLSPSERAKILLAIQQLRLRWTDNDGDSDSSSNHSGSGSGASRGSDLNDLSIKCICGEDVRRVRLDTGITLHKLKKKIKSLFGHRSMSIRYKDSDGDLISVRTEEDWRQCILYFSGREIRLELRVRETGLLHSGETQVLQAMVDPVIVIDSTGKIVFSNRASEKFTGYSARELKDQNVKVLMSKEIADQHDEYISRYLRTGVAKIIGVGRNIQMKRKDGVLVDSELSVSHTKSRRQDIFTGTIRPVLQKEQNTTANVFAQTYNLLENLTQPAVAINDECMIQFMNRKSLDMFGYTLAEAVGRNVKMLMPSPFAENHDNYVRSYIRTGEKKAIGRNRPVVAVTKGGSMIPIVLAVSEQWVGTMRIFTAMLTEIDDAEKPAEKTVLQQEREVTANLVVPAVVVDQRGVIQAYNTAAEKMWGYAFTEVVGRNVKMLMSYMDAERHDEHIKRYIETGRHKVIGVGRDVIAQDKNGDMMPIRLSVSERKDGDKRIWTGICQKL